MKNHAKSPATGCGPSGDRKPVEPGGTGPKRRRISKLDNTPSEGQLQDLGKSTGTIPAIMGRVSILPNRKPRDGVSFLRQSNGNETITITPATPENWAYGITPRKFLMVCATLKKTGDPCIDAAQRRIRFGDSYRRMMRMMGFSGHGNARVKRQIADQIRNLMQTSVGYERREEGLDRLAVGGGGFRIGEAYFFEFRKSSSSDVGKDNFVQFSAQGWSMLDGFPVLTDDIGALGRSPLAFDVYAHLVCRVYELGRATRTIPWQSLYEQYGADYTRLRDFRAAMINDVIPRIMEVWPALRLDVDPRKGLVIHPSPSPLVQAEAEASLMSAESKGVEQYPRPNGGVEWIESNGVRLFGTKAELGARAVAGHLYGTTPADECPVCLMHDGVNRATHGV